MTDVQGEVPPQADAAAAADTTAADATAADATDAAAAEQQPPPEAITGVSPETSPVPPVGAEPPTEDIKAAEDIDKGDDVEIVDEVVETTTVYEHPEPVSFATVVQDNVSEPGVQHTHSLQRDADGRVDMVKSSHGEPLAAADEPAAVEADAEAS